MVIFLIPRLCRPDKGILKPAYDAQQTIYEDLVVQLDTAMDYHIHN